MLLKPATVFAEALAQSGGHGRKIGVAVSGGSDSMALLVLALDWGRRNDVPILAATVDHGLRPEAALEAQAVAAFCQGEGALHEILVWTGWDKTGNVQAQARAARRDLLRDWAQRNGLTSVLVGHTADDQAETVLMRLARGSGVDGLAGMAVRPDDLFLRPLLTVSREDLRQLLNERGIGWQDDPSNDDLRFDRVKARRMLPLLADLGLGHDRLIQTAAHMERASASLWKAAAEFTRSHCRSEAGDLVFDAEILADPWTDTEPRCLAAALRWIGGGAYRPRFVALSDAAKAVRQGERRTLNGVMWLPEAGGVRLTRELSATQGPVDVVCQVTQWDGRWEVTAPEGFATGTGDIPSITVGPLGDHIAACPDWRNCGLPRQTLMTTPAIYGRNGLISAPLAGYAQGWSTRIVADFPGFLLSH